MKKRTIYAIALSLIGITGFGQGFSELQKVSAADRDTEDRFGWAADISGDYAIVGAYGDDFGGTNPNMGSAYIYEKDDAGDWIIAQKIFNSDQDDYDRFGQAVAIHGNIAVVGAYREDEDENDENTISKAGSVYIFERGGDGTWEEIQKIVASDRAEEDEFGSSVAVHDDLIIVGAHFCNTDATGGSFSRHAGAAYIFEQNDAGDWVELQKIVASDRFGNPDEIYVEEDWNWRYGESVGVFNDYVVIASPFAAKGYMYERSGDSWSEADLLEYPGIEWLDRVGSVSIDETTVVLGAQTWDYSEEFGDDALMNAGGAAIFDRDGMGNWNFTQMIVPDDRNAGDHFGIGVSIEGGLIVCGAHQDNHDEDGDVDLPNAGSAYIFKNMGGTWEQYDKVDASDRNEEDELGIAVSVSSNAVLVGAFQQDYPVGGGTYLEDAGAAYFFLDDDDVACPTVYSSQYPSICDGESFAVGDSEYTESGTYSNTLTSVDGCDSIVTTYLNVIGEDPYEYEVSICEGQSVIIGDSEYNEAGIYTDTFETDAGCDSIVETTVIIVEGVTDNVLTGDEDFGIFTDAFISVSFQWINCEPFEEIPGANDLFYMPTEDGWYACIVESESGCIDTSDCYLWGDEPVDDSGLEDLLLSGDIIIFPNPNNGQFNIELNQINEAIQVDVLNQLGQVIYNDNLTPGLNMIKLQDVSPGIYILKLSNETGQVYQKVIIQ